MDVKDVQWIDNASYEELLRKARHGPIGHRYFVGGTDEQKYFDAAYIKAHNAATPYERVRASKNVGWE